MKKTESEHNSSLFTLKKVDFSKVKKKRPIPEGEGDAEAVSDEEYVELFQAGSSNAFVILVERYNHRIYTLVARQVNRKSIAEEITQEVFLKAYKGLHKFKFKSRFSTWLIRIALNQLSTYYKSNSRRLAQEELTDCSGLLDSCFAGSESISREHYKNLLLFIAELPDTLKEVLILCTFEKYSYEKVAATLRIPVGTVRSRLNRARNRISNKLLDKDG